MTYRRRYLPAAPSRTKIANQRTVLDSLYGTASFDPLTLEPDRQTRKTGKQKETPYSKTIGEWGASKGGALYVNRRGMVRLANGGMFPYGLGPNGALDRIGFIPVLITNDMVGRTLPIYCEIEAKTDTGTLQENQVQRIEYLRDRGAIAGVAFGESTVEDCERIYTEWRNRR